MAKYLLIESRDAFEWSEVPGHDRADLVPGAKTVPRGGLAKLFADDDPVWHW